MAGRRSGRNKRQRAGAEEVVDVDSGEEEVADASGTQAAGPGGDDDGPGTFSSLPEEEQNKLIGRLIRVLLVKNAQKQPVRREDLIKALGTEHGRPGKLFPEAFRLAENNLRLYFGFDVKEIRRTVAARGVVSQAGRRTQPQATAGTQGPAAVVGGKHYIVVNALPASLRPKPASTEMHGFIALVAAMIILVPDGKLSDEELWRNMEKLGAKTSEADHPQLGNLKVLMEKLIKQWYFERERIDDSVKYIIGPRFRAEVRDEDLIGIVETVYSSRLEDTSRNDLLIRLRGIEVPEDGE